MSRIDEIAYWIGYAWMIAGACFFTVAGILLIADWILRKMSFPGAWFKIACELHKQKKFRWQKQEDKTL